MIAETLHTPWGTAKVGHNGYYTITSRKEGYHGKMIHRLIYGSFWGVELPREVHIHHKDENKLNNCILNLEAIINSEHLSNHNSENNTVGYFRVTTQTAKTTSQGFVYVYQYYDENHNRKSISSVDLDILKQKVIDKGLPWIKLEDKDNEY